MDRRWIGVFVLAVVAIAALVVPGAAGRRIGGSPVASAVPPPPSVGDCVSSISAIPPTDQNTDDDVLVAYPTVVAGACSAPIVGEVMSVDTNAHPLERATVGSYQQDRSTCELSEVNYVGYIGPFDPTTLTTPGIGWQADVTVQSISIGPGALQRAAGQTWTACVGAAPDRSRYRGSIKGALTTGVLPGAFATCWRALFSTSEQQIADPQVPCNTAHPVEIIAVTQLFDRTTTAAKVSASCVGMAGRALRTDDPTRGGALTIAAYAMDGSSAQPLRAASMYGGYIGCVAFVAPPVRLTGTLIGIGSKPLPTTG